MQIEDFVLVIGWILLIDEFELEDKCVNLNLVLAGVVLEESSEETLCEEESAEPEDLGLSLIADPFLKGQYSQVKIPDVAA